VDERGGGGTRGAAAGESAVVPIAVELSPSRRRCGGGYEEEGCTYM